MGIRFLATAILISIAALGDSVGAQEPIKVPAGNGTPVMIDGVFSSGEWKDASVREIGPGVQLYLKHYKDHVFIGLKTATPFRAYTDLFLALEDGTLFNLHASMQTGERILTGRNWTDEEPPTVWGNEMDWVANRSKLDPRKSSTLPMKERLLPYEGREYQLRRSRFKGRSWRIRIEVRDLEGEKPTIVFPANSERFEQSHWGVLLLE